MAKYVFLNVPAHGHVNPTLAVAQELVKRGHCVSYYLTENFRAIVEATGATFQSYQSKADNMPPMPSTFNGARGPAFLLQDMDYVPPQVIDRICAEQPDVIIYDFMCAWARTIIDELQIPAIGTRATYASNEHFNLRDRMRKWMAFMQAQGEDAKNVFTQILSTFEHVEPLNVIFIPREFQPAGETFDDRYVFVGPSILPRSEASDFPLDKLDSARPLLYISLGSVFNNQPDFYKQCFAAFGNQPWQVVLSIGKRTDLAALGEIPENFLLASYLPQLEVLPRTQIFVTHAGTNSVMESMYFGVPMVLIPQQPEQQMHAQRVEDMGLGVMLDRTSVDATTLREVVERVARDEGYRERARQMQQSVRLSGGYQQAADAIIEFTRTRVGS